MYEQPKWKVSKALIAVVLVLAIVVTCFGWPGFLLGVIAPGAASARLTGEQTAVPVSTFITGDSRPFSIEPFPGLTISAPENALDHDREFTVTEATEAQIEELDEILMTELEEEATILEAFHLDAGLEPDDLFPGTFNVSLDLAARGVPEELWNCVTAYRIDDDGNWYEYATSVENGILSLDSYQNSLIAYAVCVGVAYLIVDEIIPAWASGLTFFEWTNSMYVTENASPNGKRIYKLKWTYSAVEKEYRDKKQQIYEDAKRGIKTQDVRDALRAELGRDPTGAEINARKELLVQDVLKNNTMYQEASRALQRAQEEKGYTFEMVSRIANILAGARSYIKTLGVKMPTPVMDVHLSAGVTGGAGGVTVNPVIYKSSYLILNTSYIMVKGDAAYDDLAVTAVHELFHASQRCYKAASRACLKFDEATAEMVEMECVPWMKEQGFIKGDPTTGANGNTYLYYYALPLDSYSVTYDGSTRTARGSARSDTGYPMRYLIQYLKNKFAPTMTWDTLLHTYDNFWTSPTLTEMLKYAFGLSDEVLNTQYQLFARSMEAKFFEKAKATTDSYSDGVFWSYPITGTADMNGVDINCVNNPYTIRVRNLRPYASGGNTGDVAILLVSDPGFSEALPDFRLYPVGNKNIVRSKYGLFYKPMDYFSGDVNNCFIMEVCGGLNPEGASSHYTMWTLETLDVEQANVENGLLTFHLPEKSDVAEAGYIDGIRVTIKASDGTETVKHYKISGADTDISIRTTSLHGPLPEGQEEESITYEISMCEYINERDGSRTYGPESDTRRSSMDSLLDEMGALEGEITISLYWPSKDDLDLHCVTPDGSHIYYGNKSTGGGTLDVDMQVSGESDSGVENIYFTEPAPGEYQVYIDNYTDRTEGDTTAQIRIKVGDQVIINTTVSMGGRSQTWTFTYGPPEGEEQGQEHLDTGPAPQP